MEKAERRCPRDASARGDRHDDRLHGTWLLLARGLQGQTWWASGCPRPAPAPLFRCGQQGP